MKVLPIDCSLIDFQDKFFLVGNKDNLSAIYHSILEIGVLNPPILRKIDDKYQVVTGWKRLLSCQQIDHTEVLCKVYEYSELSDNDCLKIVFIDNKERISDLELSELILLYRKIQPADDKDIINNILPFLEIPPTRKHLDKYLSLASLDETIKNAFYKDKITIEQCQMLSELTPSNQVPVLESLLLKYNLNNNESKQVIGDISEIALREKCSVNKVIDSIESDFNQNNYKNSGKNELRKYARIRRFPELSNVQQKFDKLLKQLSLPDNINIIHHPYFETNELELRIKIKNSEGLSEIIEKLQENNKKGDIDKLLAVVIKNE
ncbi:MAG: hypothetical protein DHS20C13_07120 [Thermodesulfobacteriota bacterium]|nr:MAG: hypothetical protein DHS20C13_07120 [Thermodesulfobacteriota bacterium]